MLKEDTDDTNGVDIDDITTYDRAGARAGTSRQPLGAHRLLARDHPFPALPLLRGVPVSTAPRCIPIADAHGVGAGGKAEGL
ncbi:MAG: hypothetical protein WCB79_05750, partial [Halobacteriota archaeon]